MQGKRIILYIRGENFMSNIVESLQSIDSTLREQNEIVQKLLKAIQKPENRFIRILQVIGLGAGALAIFNIIENIIKWIITGG